MRSPPSGLAIQTRHSFDSTSIQLDRVFGFTASCWILFSHLSFIDVAIRESRMSELREMWPIELWACYIRLERTNDLEVLQSRMGSERCIAGRVQRVFTIAEQLRQTKGEMEREMMEGRWWEEEIGRTSQERLEDIFVCVIQVGLLENHRQGSIDQANQVRSNDVDTSYSSIIERPGSFGGTSVIGIGSTPIIIVRSTQRPVPEVWLSDLSFVFVRCTSN